MEQVYPLWTRAESAPNCPATRIDQNISSWRPEPLSTTQLSLHSYQNSRRTLPGVQAQPSAAPAAGSAGTQTAAPPAGAQRGAGAQTRRSAPARRRAAGGRTAAATGSSSSCTRSGPRPARAAPGTPAPAGLRREGGGQSFHTEALRRPALPREASHPRPAQRLTHDCLQRQVAAQHGAEAAPVVYAARGWLPAAGVGHSECRLVHRLALQVDRPGAPGVHPKVDHHDRARLPVQAEVEALQAGVHGPGRHRHHLCRQH